MSFSDELEQFRSSHPYSETEIDGIRVSYLLCGNENSRTELVYLVGGTGFSTVWFNHIKQMEQEYRVLTFDYPYGIETLEELADLEVPEQPLVPSGDFMYMSLCQVYMDDRGQSRLERLMDVADGRLSDGFSPDAPEYFRLYQKDGPNEEGAIGIWDWKTVPNKRDISRDYIVTAYHASAQPIEVIVCRDCPTVAELLDRLKRGIAGIFHSDRILFAVDTGDLLEGIYCDRINSTFYAGKVTLASEQIKLPVYAIERGAILRVRDLSFLSRTGLGIPRRLMQTKDPIGLVREIVLRRATWPVLQQRGFLRKEYQKMKDFLSGLPTADLYDEIRQACDCTEKEAEGYLAALISRSDASISGATMENDVMAQIIRNDPRAYRESLDVLRQDWEAGSRKGPVKAPGGGSGLRGAGEGKETGIRSARGQDCGSREPDPVTKTARG